MDFSSNPWLSQQLSIIIALSPGLILCPKRLQAGKDDIENDLTAFQVELEDPVDSEEAETRETWQSDCLLLMIL